MTSLSTRIQQAVVGTACAALAAAIAVKGGEFMIAKSQAKPLAADYKCGSLHGSASVMSLPGNQVELIIRNPNGRIRFMSTGVYSSAGAQASARDFCSGQTSSFPEFFEKAAAGTYECTGPYGEASVRRDTTGDLVIHYNGMQINTGSRQKDAVTKASRLCLTGKRNVLT